MQSNNNTFDAILINSLKIPGVKVDRAKFLNEILFDYIKNGETIRIAIETSTIEAGINQTTLDKIAKYIIKKRTYQSSGVSFAAGLPGGIAMAATIPGDILQFFGVAIRLAQELAYIYGYPDLWDGDKIDDDKVKKELTLFIGVMFGVSGASSAVRLLSLSLSKQALKKLPQKALTKTIYYPIIKKIGTYISVKVTKDSFAKSVSKVIPVVGGFVSGGITYLSMKPMGNKLKEVLSEAQFNYDDNLMSEDIKEVEKDYNIVDVEYEHLSSEYDEVDDIDEKINEKSNINIKLIECKQLLENGLISESEAEKIKSEILKTYYNIDI